MYEREIAIRGIRGEDQRGRVKTSNSCGTRWNNTHMLPQEETPLTSAARRSIG